MMNEFKLSRETLTGIMNFLVTQPYSQVSQLITAVETEIDRQVQDQNKLNEKVKTLSDKEKVA